MNQKSKIIITLLLVIGTLYTTHAQEKQTGMASYYNDKFEGRSTASGESYQKDKFTAAHPTLPFQTRVKVTNLKNDKSVVVTVNDRGPFVKERIIDVSRAAAEKLEFIDEGVTRVRIEVLEN